MLLKVEDRQAIEALAESDLPLACARARDRVAANPADEDAALLLRGLVEQFSPDPPPRARPEEFAAVIKRELQQWAKVIKAAGIKPE